MNDTEIRHELTRQQFYTMSTCGEACWEAREDVCHCSCHGKNHGILRTGNRPDRTCKISGYWYKLFEITDYVQGKARCLSLREQDAQQHPGNYPKAYNNSGELTDKPQVYYNSEPGDAFHCKAATASQMKWQEVQNCIKVSELDGKPLEQYIIWQRIEPPTA